MSATKIDKAANVAQDFSKLIRTEPSDAERTDTTAAVSTRSTQFRVLGDAIFLFDLGQNLVQQKFGIVAGNTVVFKAAIGWTRFPATFFRQFAFVTGVHHHRDRDGHRR